MVLNVTLLVLSLTTIVRDEGPARRDGRLIRPGSLQKLKQHTQVHDMKTQNVKITLLATLVTGLLMSQVASASDTTIYFNTEVAKTTCDVTAGNAGPTGSLTTNGQNVMPFGTYTKAQIGKAGGNVTIGTFSAYNIIPSQATPIMLSLSGCSGDDLLAPVAAPAPGVPAGVLQLKVTGAPALQAAGAEKNVFGDPSKDVGFGYGLKYLVNGGGTDNALDGTSGDILPTTGSVNIYENKGTVDQTAASLDLSVTITPSLAAWATTDSGVSTGVLSTPVTFSVLQN